MNKPGKPAFDWTEKRQRFVKEFLVDLCAAKAAVRAGFSESTASKIGWKLMQEPEILAAIQAEIDKRAEATGITAKRVLEEIACMALYDPADFVNVQKPEDIEALSEEARRAIAGWAWDKNGNFTLRLAAKPTALDMLAKHLSIYAPVKAEVTLPQFNKISEAVLGIFERVLGNDKT